MNEPQRRLWAVDVHLVTQHDVVIVDGERGMGRVLLHFGFDSIDSLLVMFIISDLRLEQKVLLSASTLRDYDCTRLSRFENIHSTLID